MIAYHGKASPNLLQLEKKTIWSLLTSNHHCKLRIAKTLNCMHISKNEIKAHEESMHIQIIHMTTCKQEKEGETFDTMVPQSASTCRNLGVFGNAQTKRVQSEFQSGWYSAPISSACDLNVLRSGFTKPDSTKTTPSCPQNTVE